MKKEKFFGNYISSFILIFYGFFLCCANLFHLQNLSLFLGIFFFLYGSLKLTIFIFEKNKMDLFSSIIGILFGCVFYLLDVMSSPRNLAIFILLFALCKSFIKLKKADFYHDRKSKYWLIEVANLLFFLGLSILVSINLSFEENVLFLIFGLYSFFLGVLDFYEILFYNLTRGKLR